MVEGWSIRDRHAVAHLALTAYHLPSELSSMLQQCVNNTLEGCNRMAVVSRRPPTTRKSLLSCRARRTKAQLVSGFTGENCNSSILPPLAKVPRFTRLPLWSIAPLSTSRAHRGTQGKSALSSLRQRSACASTRHFCYGQRSSVGGSNSGESCTVAADSVHTFSLLMLGRYGNVFTDFGRNDANAEALGPTPRAWRPQNMREPTLK